MERIPFWAWVGIAIIVIITVIINVSLVAMLRAKTPPRMSMRQSHSGGIIGTAQDLAKIGQVMRDPFAGERRQLNELSRLVEGLEKPEDTHSSNPNQQNDPR